MQADREKAAAEGLVQSGEFDAAYALFDAARLKYRESNPWDQSREDTVRQYRDNARPDHPQAKEAERLFARALEEKEALRYEQAYELFERAIPLYHAAARYDGEKEERAEAARAEANPVVKKSYQQGTAAFEEALARKDAGDYQAAYRLFNEAWELFRLCVYDDTNERAAREALQEADILNPRFMEYQETLREADRLKDKRGLEAEQKFATAATQLRSIKKDLGGGGPIVEIRLKPRELRDTEDAMRDARTPRGGVLDMKQDCDTWARRGLITHQTEPFYQEGLKAFEEAERHWNQGNASLERGRQLWEDKKDDEAFSAWTQAVAEYQQAIPLYEEARTQLGKVSNRTR
jgi:tetratricopeptide (TPR) repeat protein